MGVLLQQEGPQLLECQLLLVIVIIYHLYVAHTYDSYVHMDLEHTRTHVHTDTSYTHMPALDSDHVQDMSIWRVCLWMCLCVARTHLHVSAHYY